MPGQLPHRITDITRKPPDQRTGKERQRLEAWTRRLARDELTALEADLRALADAMVGLGEFNGLYHSIRRPDLAHPSR
jgi:hypothetical protein